MFSCCVDASGVHSLVVLGRDEGKRCVCGDRLSYFLVSEMEIGQLVGREVFSFEENPPVPSRVLFVLRSLSDHNSDSNDAMSTTVDQGLPLLRSSP